VDAEDFSLLRRVLTSARRSGFCGSPYAPGRWWRKRTPAGGFTDAVYWYYDTGDRDGWVLQAKGAEVPVTSITQAVDVLVAVGVLAHRHSSAFEIGRRAGVEVGRMAQAISTLAGAHAPEVLDAHR
jgi:hypothetical protein